MSASKDFGTNYDQEQYLVFKFEALWHEGLSLKAVGLLARCLSRPPNWSFNKNEMASNGKEKRRAINSALKELEQAGLMVTILHRIQGEKNGKKINRIWGNEYVFFKSPRTPKEIEEIVKERREEIKIFFLKAHFVSTGNVSERNEPLTSINSRYDSKEITSSADVDTSEKNVDKFGLSPMEIKKLKKINPPEFEAAYKFMEEQETPIDKPYGWLRKCLMEMWHKKYEVREAVLANNRHIARRIIEDHTADLLPNSSFDLSEEAFMINRGTKTVTFYLKDTQFDEKLKNELKHMGILP